MAAKVNVGARGFSQRDAIKLTVAVVLLAAAIVILSVYFYGGSKPQPLVNPGEPPPAAPTRAVPPQPE